MEKIEKSARAEAVRAYLQGIGHNITSVQAHEVLARAMGLKNKHVLAAAATSTKKKSVPATTLLVNDPGSSEPVKVKVFAVGDGPFRVEELDDRGWSVDVIIPVPLELMSDIDALNDYASKFITGNEVALEDINYSHIPDVAYKAGYTAQRVTGYISSPEAHFGMDSNEVVEFYRGINNLSRNIYPGRRVMHTRAAQDVMCSVVSVDVALQFLLEQYSAERGKNNDEVNAVIDKIAVTLQPEGQPKENQICIRLGELKYAVQLDEHRFQLPDERDQYWLDFGV